MYRNDYERWVNEPQLKDEEREALLAMDENAKKSAFAGLLSFGTAGLRGTMSMGTAKMNRFVVRHATQAMADVILEKGEKEASRGVVICFDCRNHSREFAAEAACCMAANGIPVRLFWDMRPTPELSFAIRYYRAIAGINITASHNPKEYNGYKVYWSDGAQLPPEPADAVAKKMASTDIFTDTKTMDFDDAVNAGLISVLGKETDEVFIHCAMAQSVDPTLFFKHHDMPVVFTPFHGTGREIIPVTLTMMGLTDIHCEEKQMIPDGDFSTVKSPNPEYAEGFALCEKVADEFNADIIIGSDPDADRIGVEVRGGDGKFVHLTGNQVAALLADYVFTARKEKGTLPEKPIAIKSIVSTEMVRAIAEANGAVCHDTFTGFKFIAKRKDDLEAAKEGKVVFAFEESYGYMFGDHVRDKDSVSSAVLICELAAACREEEISVLDKLHSLYEKYGWFEEKTVDLVYPGLEGAETMKALMENLRKNAPAAIGGRNVKSVRDYAPESNVLSYDLADGTRVLVRPSGTEPKVKVYVLAHGESEQACRDAVEKCSAWAETLRK